VDHLVSHREGAAAAISLKGTRGVQVVLAQSEQERRPVYRLRYDVYVAEQGKAYAQADHDERLLKDDADDYAGVCLLVTVAGQPVATVRTTHLHDDAAYHAYCERFDLARYDGASRNDMVVCSRLAILPQYRKTRVVHTVFEAIYRYEAERGVRLCFQYCAPALVPLFEHYGFREYTPVVEDPVLGQAHRMLLVLDDLDHLQRVGSPFHAIAIELGLTPTGTENEPTPTPVAMNHGGHMELSTADQQRFSQAVEEAIEAFPSNRLCQRVDAGSLEMTHYHAILTTIFHQTYYTPFTFARAAANCSWRHEAAKDYLLRHAEEERTHWRWVLNDLTTTGYQGPSLREGVPHPTCQAYIGLNSFIAEQIPVARLAIAAVLEGIGGRYGGVYAKRLITKLGLESHQTQFFLGHSETDKVHAAEIRKVIDQCELTPDEWGWMEHAARTAGTFYRAMYDHEAFV
jgi:predicted GNAT family N-acyltransferase